MILFILIYTVIGILITAIAVKKDIIRKDNWYISYLLSFLLWPLLFCSAWSEFLSSNKKYDRFKSTRQLAIKNFNDHKNLFNENEIKSFKFLAENFEDIEGNDITVFWSHNQLEESLNLLWQIDLHPFLFHDFQHVKIRFEDKDYLKSLPKYSIKWKEPKWYFGMTDEFIKSIRKVDRKTQGRILEAIKLICENPMELKGNTNKPLSGSMNGLWRYRIGNFRLIFQPDSSSKNIILLSFSDRGSAYK